MPEALGGAHGGAARPRIGAAAVGLAGLLSLAVAMGIGRFVFTPMLPLMIQDGQLDVAAGGWLAAANYLGYLVGALSAGRLPLAPARLALAALGLTVVLTAAMALPVSPPVWAALRFLAGIVSAWAFVGTSVWCLDALARRPSRDGRPSGWNSVLYAGVGGGIAVAGLFCLVGAVAGRSASALWLQLAGLAMVLAAPAVWVVWRLRAELRGTIRPADTAPAAAAAEPPGRAAPRLTGLVLCYGIYGFGYILPATFLPVMARSLVADSRLFGLAWPVFGATAVVSTLVATWWLRRVSLMRLWALSHVLMAVGVVLPGLWRSAWTIGLSALLVGGTFMLPSLAALQEARVRAGAFAPRIIAHLTAAFALGQVAGPVVSSLLLRWPHLGSAGAMDLALQIAAAGLLASGIWLWYDRPSR